MASATSTWYQNISSEIQSSPVSAVPIANRYTQKRLYGTSQSTDKRNLVTYRYKITLQYYDTARDTTTDIKNECLKSMIVDHNYDNNTMPIIYCNMKLDKSLVDDMIKNQNNNIIILSVYKFNTNTQHPVDLLCYRKQCIYFLPDDVNIMDPVDYNKETNPTMKGDTYKTLTLGLLCVDHINNNKINCEMVAKNVTMYDIVKYNTSHINNLIIEPFSYNDIFDQFVLPPHDSLNKTLQFLNNQRVFYSTPYRYYQDFDYTYIVSSAGNLTERQGDPYGSIIISIRDINNSYANEVGMAINNTSGTYEIDVNYAFTQVFDNTLVNKSKNKLKGIVTENSSERSTSFLVPEYKTSMDKTLKNKSNYIKDKVQTIRLNNDNEHMIDNIEANTNNENFLVYFSKNDLDTNLFSINKRITIHNIDRYQEFNGNYLLYRKREAYLREDNTFLMSSMINLKRIDV